MHDIGKPVLLQSMPIEYLPIVNEVYMGGASFHELEMSALGFSHAHVGALLAAKWNFPLQLAESIGYHHSPLSAPAFAKLACVTSLSNRMMIMLEVGFERNRALKLGTLPEVDFLKLNQSALDAIVNEVQTVRTQMTDTLAI
jgi:HD-like signal output (HDOD) protein